MMRPSKDLPPRDGERWETTDGTWVRADSSMVRFGDVAVLSIFQWRARLGAGARLISPRPSEAVTV